MHYYLFYESNIDSLAGDLGITLNWTETVICMSVFFLCFFQLLNYNCLLKLYLLIFCLFFSNVFVFFPIIRKSTRDFYIWLFKVPNKFSFPTRNYSSILLLPKGNIIHKNKNIHNCKINIFITMLRVFTYVLSFAVTWLVCTYISEMRWFRCLCKL